MLRRLKRQFIFAAMCVLAAVLTLIIGSINAFTYRSVVKMADRTLSLIYNNEGNFPVLEPDDEYREDGKVTITPETPYESRFFSVKFDREGGVIATDTKHIAAIDDESAVLMARETLNSERRKGFSGIYRFMVRDSEEGLYVIFLDCTRSLNNTHTFLLLSVIVSLAGMLAVFILFMLLAKRIVRPISDSYEKQRRFITDAGHDIKTPITIINADAELIEMELPNNEWLEDIKKQTKRLASLTSDLIYLSRIEENPAGMHIDFPICDVLDDVILSFSSLAISKNIQIQSEISPVVSYHGDEDAIRKLFTVLLDNAVKYSPDGECVRVTLKRQAKNLHLTVSNIAEHLNQDDAEKIFDRFYRSDGARASGGGFGIGLSVASAIVSSHKGKIIANLESNIFTIEVVL